MFESDEDYYEPVDVFNAFNVYCIKYESNGDENKTPLSIEVRISQRSQTILKKCNNLKKFNTWKIQLAMAINFMSSVVINDTR